TTAHAMKITASACANGVGLHEKPMPARRTHASPNHRLISRLERAERPSLLMFSVVILTDLLRGIAGILIRRISRLNVPGGRSASPGGGPSARTSPWQTGQDRRSQHLPAASAANLRSFLAPPAAGALQVEQKRLGVEASRKAGELAGRSDHAVAW